MDVLVGHWMNEDVETRGVIGYSMSKAEKGFGYSIAEYGKCHPSWSVFMFEAQGITSEVQEAGLVAPRYGFVAETDHGFKKESVNGFHKADRLTVTIDTVYTDDSGRLDRHSEYNFKRVAGSLRDMEATLTQTFYAPSGEPGNFSEQEFQLLKAFH